MGGLMTMDLEAAKNAVTKELKVLCKSTKSITLDENLYFCVCVTIELYDKDYNLSVKHFSMNDVHPYIFNATEKEIEELEVGDKCTDGAFIMKIEYDDETNNTIPLFEEFRGIIYDVYYDEYTHTIFLYGSNIDGLSSVIYTSDEITKSNAKIKRAINKVQIKPVTLNLQEKCIRANYGYADDSPYRGMIKEMIDSSIVPYIYCYDEDGHDVLLGVFVINALMANHVSGNIIYMKTDSGSVDRAANILNDSGNYQIVADESSSSIFIRKRKEGKSYPLIEYNNESIAWPKLTTNETIKIIMGANRHYYLTCNLSSIDGYDINDIVRDADIFNDITHITGKCLPVVMRATSDTYYIIGKAITYAPYTSDTLVVNEYGIQIQCVIFTGLKFGYNGKLLESVINNFVDDEGFIKGRTKLLVGEKFINQAVNGLNITKDNDNVIAIVLDFNL